VHFKPWGISPFADNPATELRDRWVPVDAVWQRSLDRIRNQVGGFASAAETLRVLEEELRSRLAETPSRGLDLVQHAGGRLETSHGAVPVGALADAAGVSGNHLATQFKSHVGVTPKRVARIYRFARLILSVDALRPVDWPELAQTAGYFDQAPSAGSSRTSPAIPPRNTWPCGADSPPSRGSRRTAVRCPLHNRVGQATGIRSLFRIDWHAQCLVRPQDQRRIDLGQICLYDSRVRFA
jgi:AraC-like DNA-binding protein